MNTPSPSEIQSRIDRMEQEKSQRQIPEEKQEIYLEPEFKNYV